MNKKILEIPLYIKTAIKLIAIMSLIAFDISKLPTPVMLLSIGLMAYGLITAIMTHTKKSSVKLLNRYFIAETVITIINVVFLSSFTSVSLGVIDVVAAGSVLDIVITASLVVYGVKQHRYAVITPKKSQPAKPAKINLAETLSVKVPKLENLEENFQIR